MGRRRRGRGEGSIRLRGDGRWEARVIITVNGLTGKKVTRSAYARTKTEAQKRLIGLLKEQSETKQAPNGTTLLGLTEFWESSIMQSVTSNTFQRYKFTLDRDITPRLGTTLLSRLDPSVIVQFYATMSSEGRSPDARFKAGRVLRTCLDFGVKMGLLSRNPASQVPLPKVCRKEQRPLRPEEVTRFLTTARGDRLFALYLLALDSGMRAGELKALEWSDILWDAGEVLVSKSIAEVGGKLVQKDTKTKAGRRRVRISPTTLSVLRVHQARMAGEGFSASKVFCSTTGTWLRESNLLRNEFWPLLERSGCPRIRFHDLRHTTATLLLLAGENPKVVSERLGHSSIEITLKTYSHVLPTMQERVAGIMDVFLRGSGDGSGASVQCPETLEGLQNSLHPAGLEPATFGSVDQ